MSAVQDSAGPRERIGIVVDLPATSPIWNKKVQRAEGDGSGSPVGGTETILETIPGSTTRYVDDGSQASFSAGTSYIYRYRFVRIGASDGSWSDWTDEKDPTGLIGQRHTPRRFIATSVSLEVRDDGTPVARGTASEDAEGGTIHLTIATGSDPSASDPDGTEDTVDLSAGVRAWTHTFTGTTVSKGDAASVKARAESAGEDLAQAKYIEPAGATRAGDATSFDGTPTAELREDSRDPSNIKYDLKATSGSDVSNPNLRYRSVVTDPGTTVDFSGVSWTSISDANDGAWLDQEITASRQGKAFRQLIVEVQDQAPASSPTTQIVYPVDANLDALDNNDSGKLDPGSAPGGGYAPPDGGTPPALSKYLDSSHEARQNLLSQDAGPEHSSTGSIVAYEYTGFERHDAMPLSTLDVEVGDAVSILSQVKSDSGSDRVGITVTFLDGAGGTVQGSFNDTVTVSSFTRVAVEDIEVPSGSTHVAVYSRNEDGTEAMQVKRTMLNKGGIAESFEHPPLRRERETAEDLYRDTNRTDTVQAIVQNLGGGGQAENTFRRKDSSDTERIMPKQAIPRNNLADGDGVSYSMDAAPQWAPSRHGISYHSTLGSSVNQAQRYLLEDVTPTGATARAVIQDVGATTEHNHDFTNSPDDPISSVNESQLTEGITNLPALNDEFTVRYKWQITNNDSENRPYSVTVKIFSVDDSTGTETERDSEVISTTIAGNSQDSGTEERTFTAPDMTDGGNDEFRVQVTDFTGPDGTFEVEGLDDAEDPNPGETHETATPTEKEMTGDGVKVGFHLYDPQ